MPAGEKMIPGNIYIWYSGGFFLHMSIILWFGTLEFIDILRAGLHVRAPALSTGVARLRGARPV